MVKFKGNVKTAKKGNGSLEKNGKRKLRQYPVTSFEDSINFAKEIYKLGAGEKVRRLTIFDAIGKSPDSGTSRMLINNSNKYGLTRGSYVSDFLTLSEKGVTAVSEEQSPILSLKAKYELAIADIDVYSFLYNRFVGNKLPAITVISDLVLEEFSSKDIDEKDASIIVETFIVNIKYLGLLQTISGAERLVQLEYALEKIPNAKLNLSALSNSYVIDLVQTDTKNRDAPSFDDFNKICFYITPIGDEESEFRKHSDLFLESIIVPAIQQFDLSVIRADQIDKPGTITKQIIEYIFKARLVIADLSFHNPNVFYELALRHVCRLPTVQIIRKAETIPFDLSHSRTIAIDTSDIYSLVPKLETYKAEIASQVRQVLSSLETIDNPVTDVFPLLKVLIE
jgi:hypothetical protein